MRISIAKEELRQEHTSEDTSIAQIAAAFKKIDWPEGSVNLDYGGGRHDLATNYLATLGVENLVYDPFNRSAGHNSEIVARLRKEPADSAVLANVLNVIKEREVRINVLKELKSMVKSDAPIFIQVYEGNRTGVGVVTSKGWQENRPLKDYESEIHEVFGGGRKTNGMFVINASSKVCKRNEDGTVTIQLPSGKTKVSYQFARDLVIGLIDVL